MRLRAFTLIELLVVIAIIAIIVAILFPVLASVRESGRKTKWSQQPASNRYSNPDVPQRLLRYLPDEPLSRRRTPPEPSVGRIARQ